MKYIIAFYKILINVNFNVLWCLIKIINLAVAKKSTKINSELQICFNSVFVLINIFLNLCPNFLTPRILKFWLPRLTKLTYAFLFGTKFLHIIIWIYLR